ncbi:MAG TPA: YdcF family protein, partial [Streptosporangiaceae bacterium]|nr:YdcF family protein [Streptosporangiaceae bacterium]
MLLLGLAGGFVWFVRIANRAEPAPPHADGIVALTGGAERVETALHLLAADRAAWLLVSGIGPGPDLAVLAKRSLVDAAPLAARIELGRQATSTRGNAAETAAWVKTKQIHSLIVVTAWYHMPRALTELGRALPGVALYPVSVEPEGSHQPDL